MAQNTFNLNELTVNELHNFMSFLEAMSTCSTKDNLENSVIPALQKLIPFEMYNTSLVTYNREKKMTDAFVSTNMPEEWVSPYLKKGYFYIDPVMIRMFNQMNTVQDWKDTYKRVDERDQKQFIKESMDFFDHSGMSFGAQAPDRREFMTTSLTGGFDSSDRKHQFLFGFVAPYLRVAMVKIQKNENKKLLSQTQHLILELIMDGLTQEQIAEELKIHKKTVAYHVKRIEEITDARNAASAVHRAYELRILEAI